MHGVADMDACMCLYRTKSSRSPTPPQKGAELSSLDTPASSDDEGSSVCGESDQGLEIAAALEELAIVPYNMEETPCTGRSAVRRAV